MEEIMKQKVMLIDGNSLVNRACYGVPLLSNGKGQYTNAIHGFFHIVLKLLEEDIFPMAKEAALTMLEFLSKTPPFSYMDIPKHRERIEKVFTGAIVMP